MEDRDRAQIFDEILRERMASVRHTIDEWSVPESDAFNYAQAKDLIWQLSAPLGLILIAFSAAERALQEDPGDLDLLEARERFARIGEETGQMLERILAAAGDIPR